jgi:capsule polysaccharide export protein KpsE/RkpR
VSAPDIEAIRTRIADGVFLGGDYRAAYDQFLIAHHDRTALLAELQNEMTAKLAYAKAAQAKIGEQDARIVALEAALKVCHQALIEVDHAQSVGASWYTKGHAGLYNQVAMWVRKGLEAIAAVRLKKVP